MISTKKVMKNETKQKNNKCLHTHTHKVRRIITSSAFFLYRLVYFCVGYINYNNTGNIQKSFLLILQANEY